MSFFQRLFTYLVNQVLVESLANSRAFQRFAVKTDSMLKEAATKGTQTTSQATEFLKSFKEEFSKEVAKQMKQPPTHR